ncbi:MAG: hypothetical protein V4603_14010, partial [Pseudomonadota bacterium]
MKGFGLILLYFFTWRSVLTGSVLAGVLLLVLALNALLLSPYTAFSIALLAFVAMLIVPLLSSSAALRHLISSRSLCIIPHFAFKAGCALFLLTLLTAGFLPLVSWVLGLPGMALRAGPLIFVIASLYT